MSEADCIVVGAGFAGLFAAQTLVKRGHAPLILESRSRVGGRAHTVLPETSGLAQPVDLGCSYVHGWDEGNPMRQVIAELGLDVHVGKSKGSSLHFSGRPAVSETGPEVSAMSDRLSALLRPDALTSRARSASTSLGSLIPPALLPLARRMEIGAGVTLDSLSAYWHPFARPCVGTDASPLGGYVSIVDRLVSSLGSSSVRILTDARVSTIEHHADEVKVVCQDGRSFTAPTVICTVPLGVLKDTGVAPRFVPELDGQTRGAMDRVRVGTLEKVYLSYREAWWPDPSTVAAHTFLPPEPPASRKGALEEETVVVENLFATAPTPHPTLLVLLNSTLIPAFSSKGDEDLAKQLHEFLVSSFRPTVKPLPPKSWVVTSWSSDPDSLGATSAPTCIPTGEVDGVPPSPADFLQLGRAHWDGRLGFAGEHTDVDGRGSVVGAVRSGQREGLRVSTLLDRARL